MNMMLNSLTPAPAAAADAAALPAAAAGAPEDARALPGFAQWLGLDQQPDAAALPALADSAAADADSAADSAGSTDPLPGDQAAVAAQDNVLLAAMALPVPLQAAAPAFAGAGMPANDPAQPAAAAGGAAALPLTAAELRTGLPGAAPAGNAAAQAAAAPLAGEPRRVTTAAAAPAQAGDARGVMLAAAGAFALPVRAAPAGNAAAQAAAVPLAGEPRRVTTAAAAPAQAGDARGVMLAAAGAFALPVRAATPAPAAADAAPRAAAAGVDPAPLQDADAAPAADRQGGGWGVTSALPAAGRPAAADSVVLAGPPAAWRQTLHEALGERLNLQLTKNAEQAVIRLDPPMLGRIEIAIRHSGGGLEVSLSATHSEVLRQLHSVSDNLRNDLAQRQFSDVSVTVSAAPRGNGTAHPGDQQGRGRQPAREDQPQDPGRALADAGDPASPFSLNGRA
jgi:flagellar hook-length control protein FliK